MLLGRRRRARTPKTLVFQAIGQTDSQTGEMSDCEGPVLPVSARSPRTARTPSSNASARPARPDRGDGGGDGGPLALKFARFNAPLARPPPLAKRPRLCYTILTGRDAPLSWVCCCDFRGGAERPPVRAIGRKTPEMPVLRRSPGFFRALVSWVARGRRRRPGPSCAAGGREKGEATEAVLPGQRK